MKVVLDTNVIVSAVLTAHGVCAQIFDMLTDGVFGIYADDRILAEYDSVLRRPYLRLIPDDAAEVMELIRSVAEPVGAIRFPLNSLIPGTCLSWKSRLQRAPSWSPATRATFRNAHGSESLSSVPGNLWSLCGVPREVPAAASQRRRAGELRSTAWNDFITAIFAKGS